MTSPLHPKFQKQIHDEIDLILLNQINPWMFLNSGKPITLKQFNGRTISYEGNGFEGSPRRVFWSGYIEPFLENLVIRQIENANLTAQNKNVDLKTFLPELQDLLVAGCRKVYDRMAEVDQRLLGKGFPENVQIRSIEHEFELIKSFISDHINAELRMWKPKRWYDGLYERHKSAIGILSLIVGIAGLILAFL